MTSHLRVFQQDLQSDDKPIQEPTIRVSLGELLPLIAIAKRHNYLWLQDFLDDEVCITPDLYDIIRAFQSYRTPA